MRDDPHDVQTLSTDDMTVYEAVAYLAVDDRVAETADVARVAALPEEAVRRSLAVLAEKGWIEPRGGAHVLGPHDWSVER
ncbi:hypothetical protein [Planomonospora sp. ID82291]|uniref:hypothetical protein n=1 Tax=Planomonospora sp. ID82291 TaxID=2738136 RepID=UPI0018C45007|nr:hypothetical protein [Planomonospora sp. ID82291]MBG0816135.1 hypothetical protein [Planomonospora sp. ID82291]